MKWDSGHQSDDVVDRRGARPVGAGGLNLLLWLLLRTRYGWIVVLLVGLAFAAQRFGLLGGGVGTTSHGLAAGDTQAHFVAFVLDDAQTYWEGELGKRGRGYPHAKLVLFTDQTQTACGFGDAATGPFYCPSDERVYLDLGFFDVLSRQLGAQGEFARAYVVAHEIGHHVQKLLGISDRAERGNVVGPSGNSVKLELQADCYAGVWAHSAMERALLETGDLDSALGAASRIGDDVLQKEETGRVRPEKFTHGTAEQRYRWLRRGYDRGALDACDTFSAPSL